MNWPAIACSVALVAANVALAECAPPPVTTTAQAVRMAGEHLGLSDTEVGAFHADVSRHDGSWRVSLYDPTPHHRGGPGGETVIDVESGKMLSRVFYR